ncbi:MAG: SOS response-associated peptidase [bacterium]
MIIMCGRITITVSQEHLEKRFEAKFSGELPYSPRFNATPMQMLPTIVYNDYDRRIEFMRWGLQPVWWKQESRSLINIRKETLGEKNTFAYLLENQRCLVLADGFYEWKREGKTKVPYWICLKSGGPFAFPGVWEVDKDRKTEKKIQAFSIFTTEPNALVCKIHNRMPCILGRDDENKWLDRSVSQSDLIKLLKAYPAGDMETVEVSQHVNSPGLDNPILIEPVKRLFA